MSERVGKRIGRRLAAAACLVSVGGASAWAADGGPAASAGFTLTPLLVYCGLVMLSAWLGGVLPSFVRLTHTRLQFLVSLIGGLMLGVGLLHQLPHAVVVLADAHHPRPLDWSLCWMLGGLAAMFLMLRLFHFHHHETFESPDAGDGHLPHAHDHDHDHSGCGGRHDHDHDHGRATPVSSPVARLRAGSWIGVALGLSLHTLTDGLALASHVEADLAHAAGSWLPGLGTFLGIALHKPLDSLSIMSLMAAAGASVGWRRAVNFAYALLCPLGALLFVVGVRALSAEQNLVVGSALALSAGVFVCIALSDLLPEVEFHSHDRLPLSAALLVGMVLAWGIGFLEPEHTHSPTAAGAVDEHGHHDHDHDGHSHPHPHPH